MTHEPEAERADVQVPDWDRLIPAAEPADLPTYAFQRERYWLDGHQAGTGQGGGDGADTAFWAAVDSGDLAALTDTLGVGEAPTVSDLLPALADWRRARRRTATTDNWRYTVTWKPATTPTGAAPTGRWLLVADPGTGESTTAGVADALAAGGADVVRVDVPEGDGSREEYAALLAAAGPADGVLSTLGLAEASAAAGDALTVGLARTLALVQAVGDAGTAAPLWLVTRGGVGVGRHETPGSLAMGQIWGLGRVGRPRTPRTLGRVGGPARTARRPRRRPSRVPCSPVSRALRTRSPYAPPASSCAAWSAPRSPGVPPYAPGGPAAPSWSPAPPAPSPRTSPTGSPPAAPATSSSSAAAAPKPPARRSWPPTSRAWAYAPPSPPATSRTAPPWKSWSGDSTPTARPSPASCHAAAAIRLLPIETLTAEQLDRDLRAKVLGTRNLHEVFGPERPLDAFVLFSSIAGVWGSGVHAAYAAGNTYLDGLAEQRRAPGLPATSVAWGVWAAVNQWPTPSYRKASTPNGSSGRACPSSTRRRRSPRSTTSSTTTRPSSPSPTSTGTASRPPSPPPAPARSSTPSPRYAPPARRPPPAPEPARRHAPSPNSAPNSPPCPG